MITYKLTWLWRFYLYSLHGLAIEVIYTALWDLIAKRSLKLIGVSSIWALFIYGLSTFFIELVSPFLINKKIPLLARGLLYTIWTFLWEFSTGYLLSLFDACPWDYSEIFMFNIKGLITMEYAPFWFIGSLMSENYLVPIVKQIQISISNIKSQ